MIILLTRYVSGGTGYVQEHFCSSNASCVRFPLTLQEKMSWPLTTVMNKGAGKLWVRYLICFLIMKNNKGWGSFNFLRFTCYEQEQSHWSFTSFRFFLHLMKVKRRTVFFWCLFVLAYWWDRVCSAVFDSFYLSQGFVRFVFWSLI